MSKEKNLERERDKMLEKAMDEIKDWSNIHGINKNMLEDICIETTPIGQGIFLSGCIPKYIDMMNIGKPMLTEIHEKLSEKKYNKLLSKDIHVRFDRNGGLYIAIPKGNFTLLPRPFSIPNINKINISHNNTDEKTVHEIVQEVVDKYKLTVIKELNLLKLKYKYNGTSKNNGTHKMGTRIRARSRRIPVNKK